MANVIYVNGTFSTQTPEGTTPLGLSTQVNCTGSNSIQIFADIATTSWQPLYTASLTDLRYAAFYNYGDSTANAGIIEVASDSAGTKLMSILQPGDSAVIPWSASIGAATLYAKAFNNSSSLAYQLAES